MINPRHTIVIGDDHHLIVDSLSNALQADFEVVGTAGSAAEILAAVRRSRPDVLLLDLSLPGRNGLDLIPELRAVAPATRIIIVTMHLDRLLADRAFAAGAMGFLPKDAGLSELSEAIHVVMAGGTALSPRVASAGTRVAMLANHAALGHLTPRQHEIISLIAAGHTSQEIATQLGLSERTIAFHRANIRTKLGVDTTYELMRYAVLLQLDQFEVDRSPAERES